MSQHLKVLAFIAPLLRLKDASPTGDTLLLKYDKNELNDTYHDLIISELHDYILDIIETNTHWLIILSDINLLYSLYLDLADAEFAMVQMMDCSVYNLRSFIYFDRALYGVRDFIANCFKLLNLTYSPAHTSISEPMEQPYGYYLLSAIEVCVPATIATYNTLQSLCTFEFGISHSNVDFLTAFPMRTANSVPWTNVVLYTLHRSTMPHVTGQHPILEDDCMRISLVEVIGGSSIFPQFDTCIRLWPGKCDPEKKLFTLTETSELLDAGYVIASPKIITNNTKGTIKIILQRMYPSAVMPPLPFAAIKLVPHEYLCIPCNIDALEPLGPSN